MKLCFNSGMSTVLTTVSTGVTLALAPPLGYWTAAAFIPSTMNAASTGMSVCKLMRITDVLARVEQLLKSAERLKKK